MDRDLIKNFSQLFLRLSHGRFPGEVDFAMDRMIRELQRQKGPNEKIKGRLTIAVDFILEENRVELVPTVNGSTPKNETASTVMFVTDAAELSLTDTVNPTFDDLQAERDRRARESGES